MALLGILPIALTSCDSYEELGKSHSQKKYYETPLLTPRLLQKLEIEGEISKGDQITVFGFLQVKNSEAYLYEYKDLSQVQGSPLGFKLLLESYVDNGISSPADCDRKYSSVSGEASLSSGIFSMKNIIGITCYEPRNS